MGKGEDAVELGVVAGGAGFVDKAEEGAAVTQEAAYQAFAGGGAQAGFVAEEAVIGDEEIGAAKTQFVPDGVQVGDAPAYGIALIIPLAEEAVEGFGIFGIAVHSPGEEEGVRPVPVVEAVDGRAVFTRIEVDNVSELFQARTVPVDAVVADFIGFFAVLADLLRTALDEGLEFIGIEEVQVFFFVGEIVVPGGVRGLPVLFFDSRLDGFQGWPIQIQGVEEVAVGDVYDVAEFPVVVGDPVVERGHGWVSL